MPSPIAHAATGYFLSRWSFSQKQSAVTVKDWTAPVCYSIFVAISPDFDFIPQLLTGEKYHHTITHSITFAIVFTLVAGSIGYLLHKKLMRIYFWTLLLYSSHIVLDYFTAGGRGVQLFWPFSEMMYISPVSVFPGTNYSKGLFHISHLKFVFCEVIYAIALFAVWRFFPRTKRL